MICIVDYGVGNLAAIHNMLRRIGIQSVISSEPQAIEAASKLILPGVGAFDEGMRNLHARGLPPLLTRLVHERRVPVLGICLGMQLMGLGSDEGSEPGLGWVPMRFKRFAAGEDRRLKSLHMGWNLVEAARDNVLLQGYERPPRFYFVHGYYAVCEDPADVLGTADYGARFAAVIGHGNMLGVQFHPEKSHRFGMQLLRNFAEAA